MNIDTNKDRPRANEDIMVLVPNNGNTMEPTFDASHEFLMGQRNYGNIGEPAQ